MVDSAQQNQRGKAGHKRVLNGPFRLTILVYKRVGSGRSAHIGMLALKRFSTLLPARASGQGAINAQAIQCDAGLVLTQQSVLAVALLGALGLGYVLVQKYCNDDGSQRARLARLPRS